VRPSLVAAVLLALFMPASVSGGPSRWAVYYAADAELIAFASYELLVLDADRHPPLGPLADRGKTLLGYLSLCEISRDRPYYREVEAEGLLLGDHAVWKGASYVDIRDPRWLRRVVEELIPRLLRAGFTGLFLDTLDDASYLEGQRAANSGMKAAAVRLVKTIRRHYPGVTIMMNRGYDLLPEVDGHIDAVLGESVHATYDRARQRYVLVDNDETARQVRLLERAKARRPGLRLFSLDYWDPDDARGLKRVYDAARANGFEPYVGTIELDRLVAEPK
jgi:uncharacterized protein (TIGR01370 family)